MINLSSLPRPGGTAVVMQFPDLAVVCAALRGGWAAR